MTITKWQVAVDYHIFTKQQKEKKSAPQNDQGAQPRYQRLRTDPLEDPEDGQMLIFESGLSESISSYFVVFLVPCSETSASESERLSDWLMGTSVVRPA